MISLENKKKEIDNIIINQFMGLGDILFSIPIAEKLNNIGYNIIWPVNSTFLNLQKNFDNIKFVSKDEFNINYDIDSISVIDNNMVIPLRYANNLLNNGNPITCMSDKYKMINMSLNEWTSLSWKRDLNKENELYYDILGLSDNEEYNLINESFSMTKKINIDCNNGLKNIKFDIIDGFNVLDWYKVISNSKNIHTVGTSIVFIIEVIPTNKLCDYFLYARRPDEIDCSYYNYLLKKPTREI